MKYVCTWRRMMYVLDVDHICSDIRVAIYMSHYIYQYELRYTYVCVTIYVRMIHCMSMRVAVYLTWDIEVLGVETYMYLTWNIYIATCVSLYIRVTIYV